MSKFRQGGHTPAFVLLFLAETPTYGGELLKRFEKELPHNVIDSPSLYRTLNKLEEQGAVKSTWQKQTELRQIKLYELTEFGYNQLALFNEDIQARYENLTLFLKQYEKLKEIKDD